MKLAIYAISKNEEKNVDAFMDSCGDIPVYVLDHSIDGTAEKLRARGAHVDTTPIDPFRFDEAKNFALSLVPDDVQWVINLDLDERLSTCPGAILHSLNEIDKHSTLVRHFYKPDHEIDRLRHECRLHHRHAYRWNLPIHERLEFVGGVAGRRFQFNEEKIAVIDKILITQYPSRERKHTWSDRLLAAVKEYPNEPRLRMLCGRDLYFDGRYKESLEHLIAFLALPRTDDFDRSYVHSLASKCYGKLGDGKSECNHQHMAVGCCLDNPRRESYVELAHGSMKRGHYHLCLMDAERSLTITEGQYAPHNDPGAWTFKPYELKSIALYNIGGRISEAIDAAEKALSLATGDDAKRISENLKIMKESL